jgi:hypothetical protein
MDDEGRIVDMNAPVEALLRARDLFHGDRFSHRPATIRSNEVPAHRGDAQTVNVVPARP